MTHQAGSSDRGVGLVTVLIAIVVVAVLAFVAFRWYPGSRATPPATAGSPSSAASTPAATPAAPAGEQQPEPPAVATDPSFREERGRKIAALQDIPDYPGATIVGSAEQARAGEPAEGYRALWTTTDGVAAVMAWYRKTLPSMGWSYKPASDSTSEAEQTAYIRKGNLEGYVAAESEEKKTEITVSLQDVRRRGVGQQDVKRPDASRQGASRDDANRADASFSFGAAGDFDHGSTFKKTVQTIATHNPNFVVLLGDLSYDNKEQEWCDFWKTTGKYDKVILLSGNHDSGESSGGSIDRYIAACRAPEMPINGSYGRQYFFDFPATAPLARFIMVSPGVKALGLDEKYNKGRQGYTFTENAIDDARTKGIKWIFVGMHKNYISPMEKSNEVSTDTERTFMSMLLAKKVDVILQGHEHGYARTKQLATNGTTCRLLQINEFNPACVADQDDRFVKGAGTVIHILGTGGQGLRDLWTTDREFPYFASGNVKSWGFGHYTVSASTLSYTFRRSAGDPFADSFTIAATP